MPAGDLLALDQTMAGYAYDDALRLIERWRSNAASAQPGGAGLKSTEQAQRGKTS